MYRKIIVPLDGSVLAEAALAQLPHLVGPETEVVLVRVYEPATVGSAVVFPPYGSGGSPVPVATPVQVGPPADEVGEIRERARYEAQEYLETKAESLTSWIHHRRTLALADASPSAAIAALARDEEADLIIMSTHGRSGAVRWILGSVADKVLHSTHIPILLVRPSEPSEREGRGLGDGE